MIAGFHQSHRGINRGHAGRESISESCAFQGGQIALQRQPSGVGGAGVLKALVFPQALLSIRRGLIDWSADGTGTGVRLLAGMNSSSSKTHKKNPTSPKPRMQEVGSRRTDSSVCMILVSIQESLLTAGPLPSHNPTHARPGREMKRTQRLRRSVLVQFERNHDLTAGNADVSSATRRRCEVVALLEKIVAVNSFGLCAQGGRAVRAPSPKDLADLKLNQYQIPPDHSPTKKAPTKNAL